MINFPQEVKSLEVNAMPCFLQCNKKAAATFCNKVRAIASGIKHHASIPPCWATLSEIKRINLSSGIMKCSTGRLSNESFTEANYACLLKI